MTPFAHSVEAGTDVERLDLLYAYRPDRPRAIDMFNTCIYARSMPKMIQIRNVPDGLHRQLKSRAALAGMSLSDYLLAEIRRSTERPTLAEMKERLATRATVAPAVSPADAVRAERDGR